MVIIEKATQLPVPAARVFDCFMSREGRMELMAGYVSDIRVEGQGLGSVWRMYTHGHIGEGCVVERTTHYDPGNFEMAILMIDTGGYAPVADYRSRVRVIPAGKDACVVLVSASFVPVDMDEATAARLVGRNYELLFANLRRLFAAPGGP